MEKRVVLAIALTIGLWFAFITFFAPKAPPRPPGEPGVPPAAQGTTGAATAPKPPAARGGRPVATQYPDVTDPAATRISNGKVDLSFDAKGGALRSAESWDCAYHEHGDRSVAGDPGAATAWVPGLPGALAADVASATIEIPDLASSNWKLASRADGAATWEFEGPGFLLTRTVTLSSDPDHPWHADVEYSFKNVSLKPGPTLTFEVFGPVTPAPGPNEYDAGLRLAQSGDDGDVESLTPTKARSELAEKPGLERQSSTGKWAWIAACADSHLGALIPTSELPAGTSVGLRAVPRPDATTKAAADAAVASFRIPLVVPAAGAETKFQFRFFVGPNQRSLLLDDASPYRVLARAVASRTVIGIKLTWISLILAWLLRLLASTGMGYGLAVLSLTVIVRGAMFPVSRKSQISMRVHAQKMQRLKPKLDAIKEKHKDTRKQQEATMKVMREEKVSMLPAGCLLAFVQMPIWIALYGVLQSTFEMRHAGFLWIQDLTASDHLARLPFAEGWVVLNGWLNLLPLLMMGTWYASAAMQPLPDDPQQAQTAKMMRWMPVVMGLFLYSYPAGLTLYMTTSALWSIGETWLIKKVWLSKLT
jgi:YidC/Oxa1 family membrane protein insertase